MSDVREVKGIGGLDTVGVAKGEEIPQRIKLLMELAYEINQPTSSFLSFQLGQGRLATRRTEARI